MIRKTFDENRPLFIPFAMAGHPNIETSTEAIIALGEVGANIIEIGVPFSDPIADGPINQQAAEIALKQGMNLSAVLEQVTKVRKKGCKTPIILFSYLNPILAFGYELFAQKAKAAGVDGVLIVDLPPEEGFEFYNLMKTYGLEIVLLTSPTTDPKRFELYKKLAPSFIYHISRLAVTGLQQDLSTNLESGIKQLRAYLPGVKIAIGFGISTIEQAIKVARIADGVIIGSILVKTLEEQGIGNFKALTHNFATAIESGA